MTPQEAQDRRKDFAVQGLLTEIQFADQAWALAECIGRHSAAINAAGYGHLFANLQVIVSDRQTLALRTYTIVPASSTRISVVS